MRGMEGEVPVNLAESNGSRSPLVMANYLIMTPAAGLRRLQRVRSLNCCVCVVYFLPCLILPCPRVKISASCAIHHHGVQTVSENPAINNN